MTSFSPLASTPAKLPHGVDLLRRKPQRVTTTINWQLHQRLQAQADEQGRSLSGLIAFLLERSEG